MSNLKTEHEIEIDKIHDAQLAAKDAEIERMTEQAFKFRDWCLEKDKLITELCDALESSASRDTNWARQTNCLGLIKRARENGDD